MLAAPTGRIASAADDPLPRLCRDRPLVTPELHTPNDFYGHASLLKRYAGLAPGRPLRAVVEHGIMLNGVIWDVDLASELGVFLCAAEAHAREFERRAGGAKRALAIGPILRYLPAGDQGPPGERCLLAFPTHSTHRVRAEFDSRAFADHLEELGRGFDRVVVCVYWKDVLHGLHLAFRSRGFDCVSAGHMFDFEFLPRLVRILGSASMVVTNEIGTQILMATLMGKPVVLRRTEVRYFAAPEVLAVDAPSFLDHPAVMHMLQLFTEPRSEPSPEQRRFVEDLCGEASVRTPAELRAILEEAEEDYRRRLTPARRARDLILRGLYHGRRLVADLRGG